MFHNVNVIAATGDIDGDGGARYIFIVCEADLYILMLYVS